MGSEMCIRDSQLGGMFLVGLATILSKRIREMNRKYVDAARV